MRHLTLADYRRMPWANGRGTTVELLREDGPAGMTMRLSMARVEADGPFSVLPGIERNLTVISGPGFRLEGEGLSLRCAPFVPVGFPGDVPVQALGTGGGASEDFNVMTERDRPRPEVAVERPGTRLESRGTLFLFALDPCGANGIPLQRHDLLIASGAVQIDGPGAVIAVRLER